MAATLAAKLTTDTRQSGGEPCQKTLEASSLILHPPRHPRSSHTEVAQWTSPKQIENSSSYTSSALSAPWSTRSGPVCVQKIRKPDIGSKVSFSTNAEKRRSWCARLREQKLTAADDTPHDTTNPFASTTCEAYADTIHNHAAPRDHPFDEVCPAEAKMRV